MGKRLTGWAEKSIRFELKTADQTIAVSWEALVTFPYYEAQGRRSSGKHEGVSYNPNSGLSNGSSPYLQVSTGIKQTTSEAECDGDEHIPMNGLYCIGWLSGCDASPGSPRRGSSSPLLVCSGIPVADAIVTLFEIAELML